MNILPVSDLRNYNAVLRKVDDGSQIILTKNGRAKYSVMDFEEAESLKKENESLKEELYIQKMMLRANKAIENGEGMPLDEFLDELQARVSL